MYIQAFVVPVICGPLIKYSSELTRSSYEHLRDLPLADRAGGGVLPVSILIGADYYWSLVEGTLVRGAPWEPVALATKLGFVLSGPTVVMCDDVHANTVNLTATHVLKVESSVINHDDLTSELKKFWDYESFGIHDDNATLYDKFVNEVEIVEGRYQARLPLFGSSNRLPMHRLYVVDRKESFCELVAHISNVAIKLRDGLTPSQLLMNRKLRKKLPVVPEVLEPAAVDRATIETKEEAYDMQRT